ncbi:unnamed protein product [Cyclocybe aegerita]|uniref:Uncharacterized protein n=1 Tax=Cyclocybe aegerita TaxID=1973307 RepID=A0A8S0XZ50_CYCAE|nr:unnamed protein product [Cyclocybe aegerita]
MRYTEERKEQMGVNKDRFLWEDEEKLVHYLIKVHEEAFAWTEEEKGKFLEEHVLWVLGNIPIPPGIYEQVIEVIKNKIKSGVYEPSNSSYCSQWFCVVKKDGKSLQIVHDLQPLNTIAIKDSGLPPVVETYAKAFGGQVCYGQYTLKFRDTVEDLPGDLEVLTTSIAKATDWVLWAAHHDLLTIDGGNAFAAQMTSFVNPIMATDFSRIRAPGNLNNFSLASLLKAETSSKDEPTSRLAPALDNLGRPASPSCIPASKKRKGFNCPVPPPPQKKSKVAYSCPGPPLPINRPTKPKPQTTWAGIAHQAAMMPPPPPGLGLQHGGPTPPPSFLTGLMKTLIHCSIPSFTSKGPTQKQILVLFSGTPPDLTKFFTESAVQAVNRYLRDGHSMLKVTSIGCAYDSMSLTTPAVASPSDLDIVCNFVHNSLPMGTPFTAALPSSTSLIKILDVPYFNLKNREKITQEVLEKAL